MVEKRKASGGGFRIADLPAAHKNEPSLLQRMFGDDFAMWGIRSGTLRADWLGRNPTLSPSVARRLATIGLESFTTCARGLKAALRNGWKIMPARDYNHLAVALDLVTKLVGAEELAAIDAKPPDYDVRLTDLIKSYIAFRALPDASRVLLRETIQMLDDAGAADIDSIRGAFRELFYLNDAQPTLEDCLVALHRLNGGAAKSIDELERSFPMEQLNTRQFLAPPEELDRIKEFEAELRGDLELTRRRLGRLHQWRKDFLDFQEDGSLNLARLTPALLEGAKARKLAPADNVREALRVASMPHHLLSIMLQDIQRSLIEFFEGSVTVRKNQQRETIHIFKRGIFVKTLGLLERASGKAEHIAQMHRNQELDFAILWTASGDHIVAALTEAIQLALLAFRQLCADIEIVLENHNAAQALADRSAAPESLLRTQKLPIEACILSPRFLPLADWSLETRNRHNDKTILQLVREMMAVLLTLRLQYRDPELSALLVSEEQLNAEVARLESELNRLSGAA